MFSNTYWTVVGAATLLLFAGCKKGADPAQLKQYLQDPKNGLVKQFSQNGLQIVCAYKPKESVFKEAEQTGGDSEQNNAYCTLSFAINGQEAENAFLRDEQLHTACLNYLNNNVYGDVSLCTPQDTIPASASIYARQYGAGKTSSVLVVFSKGKTDLSRGFDILYQGARFGVGPVRFSFTADAVNHIPALQY